MHLLSWICWNICGYMQTLFHDLMNMYELNVGRELPYWIILNQKVDAKCK